MHQKTIDFGKRVDELIATGMTREASCHQVGMPLSTYQRYKSGPPKKKRLVLSPEREQKIIVRKKSYQALPLSSPVQQDFVIKCGPGQMAEFIKEISVQFGGMK